jgi:Zn-finger nucleic acid-binding protein
MKCPSCKETNLVMAERQGVEIDYCPDCRGVWLDRGELDKILERARAEELPPRREVSLRDSRDDRYRDDRDESRYYKHKRKKSLLEQIFD